MTGILRAMEKILGAALSSLPVLAVFSGKNWQMSKRLKRSRFTFPFTRCGKIFVLHINFHEKNDQDNGANENNENVHESVGERAKMKG